MLGSPCTKMVMHLTSEVGLGFYGENGKRNSIFEKSSYRVTRLLNCRVSEPPSHQQISEDITRPFRNQVFKLTQPLAYQVIIDYPNIRAYARACLFQFWTASLFEFWKRKASVLESEQVLLLCWRFPPDDFIPHHWLVAVVPLLFVVAHLSWQVYLNCDYTWIGSFV